MPPYPLTPLHITPDHLKSYCYSFLCSSSFRVVYAWIQAKNWTVDGELVSLAEVGYASIGIDEGWEGCGMGINHTQHYLNGTPAVNNKFPDMKGLVDLGELCLA